MSDHIIDEDNYLIHYGILRRSGRYPWGSGGTTLSRSRRFVDVISELRESGMTDTQIARTYDMSSTEFRQLNSIAKNEITAADTAMAVRLKEKGLSNVAIGERMGRNESSVRALLSKHLQNKEDILTTVVNRLREEVDSGKYIDVGSGVEHWVGLSKEKLAIAVARLKVEGYKVIKVQEDQLGTNNRKTTIKVLAPPDADYRAVVANRQNIQILDGHFEDGGRSFLGIQPPISVNPRRVAVKYAEDGGADADGVIYVRPGAKDLSLGGNRYAQVRIAVGKDRYLKGMAMYKDDLPDGVDLMFNTAKSYTGNKMDAFKKMKTDKETGDVDLDNPFGAVIRQITDPKTKKVTSAMNLVNEEGNWDDWSRTLSSQMLSKQSTKLIREQLDITRQRRQDTFDEIMALTNPAVRKKLLEDFAEDVDAAAVHLKAAEMPRQRNQVILPINSLKDNEVYAPNFNDGDRVVLVRFPHGGIFEIPELTVNNRNREARKSITPNAQDAIGINAEVAKRLSGADFDGDTVLVIPNNNGRIKTAPALEGLKGFDPQARYPKYEGMPVMSARTKGIQMGLVSNLITDMSIKGAPMDEIARAVRHSMVVIDAEKHELNYRQSAIDNGIGQLMKKYQKRSSGGASTLISQKKTDIPVPERKQWNISKKGSVDPKTGAKIFEETGASYVDKNGKTIFKTTKVKKLEATDNAHTLSSGTQKEKIYADHSNSLKAMANKARLEAVRTKLPPANPDARAAYSNEVATLNSKLAVALRNRPLERQAQVIANHNVKIKQQSQPDMDKAELKKLKGMALEEARTRTGARKQRIEITPSEWAAIQAGAVAPSRLKEILDNADMEVVKTLATPKATILMTSAKTAKAQSMIANGYTQAEIAAALGVSLTTLKTTLNGGG